MLIVTIESSDRGFILLRVVVVLRTKPIVGQSLKRDDATVDRGCPPRPIIALKVVENVECAALLSSSNC
ncbi:hypothetical protein C0J52_06074 [Blattella germanica]|nr:hypothetical protein C0J52_06074 [Blattella germanica]